VIDANEFGLYQSWLIKGATRKLMLDSDNLSKYWWALKYILSFMTLETFNPATFIEHCEKHHVTIPGWYFERHAFCLYNSDWFLRQQSDPVYKPTEENKRSVVKLILDAVNNPHYDELQDSIDKRVFWETLSTGQSTLAKFIVSNAEIV
jgi:hypothetical protein